MEIYLRRYLFTLVVEMLKIGLVIEEIVSLRALRAGDGTAALVNEGEKSDDKGIDKLVFVGEIGLVVINVEDFRRNDVVTVY